MNTLRSPRVGLLHLAVAVCIGGAAVAQAPNFLSALPERAPAGASESSLSFDGGFTDIAPAPVEMPTSPALLGMANAPAATSIVGSTQGSGTLEDPYIKVQVPGFDELYDAQVTAEGCVPSSPWKFYRESFGFGGNNPLCPSTLSVRSINTGRQHARLFPFYWDNTGGQCGNGPYCPPTGIRGMARQVELTQGYIDAGTCPYGSIAFDVRIVPNIDDLLVCLHNAVPNPTYLVVTVDERRRETGASLRRHQFRIDRFMRDQYGLLNWRRLTFHFQREAANSLFEISFVLGLSHTPENAASGNAGCAAPQTLRYPASVDIDNVSLETIPAGRVRFNKQGQITSGCPSAPNGGCAGAPITLGLSTYYCGLGMPNAAHDSLAQQSCPQGQNCPSDLNLNGNVDAQDLAILLSVTWGPLPPLADCNAVMADLNGDGAVGAQDLAILLGAWGPCSL